MTLCDLSRLERFNQDAATMFKQRLLEIGVTPDRVAPFVQVAQGLPDRLRNPIRRWHLSQVASPLGPILRVFCFTDGVPEAELRHAINNDVLLDAMHESGLLQEQQGKVLCPLRLHLVDQHFVFTDDLGTGQDAVMGAGFTTATAVRAAWPHRPIAQALDVGCGAGTASVLIASEVERVVGVDINPRVLPICRLNALLAGMQNIEFLQGDLFAPVASSRFDLVVSQPPFVSQPDGTACVTFMHGGRRGDELLLRLLRGLPPRLAPRGRAVLLVDWPRYDDIGPCARIREALHGAALDLLVLLSTPKDLDEYVTLYAASMHPDFGPEFDQAAFLHREHLHRMGITELRLAIIVLRQTENNPWTHLVEALPFTRVQPTAAQIDRLISAQDLLAAGAEELFSARLRIPEGTRIAEQDGGSLRVELPESRLIPALVTSHAGADLLVQVDNSPNVKAAIDVLCQRLGLSGQGGANKVLDGVRGALSAGLLEVSVPA